MPAPNSFVSGSDDLRKKIMMAAGAVMALMVLFPPKVVTMTLLGQSDTQSVGYSFLFSDPSATPLGPNPLASSSIAWMRLLIQLIVVAAIAFGATKVLAGSANTDARSAA